MATREIHQEDWQKFCQRFAQFHQRSPITVETIGAAGQLTEVAKELPLQQFAFKQNDCSDEIDIILDCPTRREMMHRVIQPIHIKLREGNEGKKLLQIDAESGSSLVTFHSGRVGELLDGLKTV